jgi:hypothetical protein
VQKLMIVISASPRRGAIDVRTKSPAAKRIEDGTFLMVSADHEAVARLPHVAGRIDDFERN